MVFNELDYLKNVKAKTLSGGERRLIETFLILKANYKIILLDEPFSHLAPIHIEKIKALIQCEKSRKIIILTDQLYRDLTDISHSLYLISDGSTIKINSVDELEDYGYIKMTF